MAAAKRKPAAKKPAAKAKKPAVKKPAAKKCGAASILRRDRASPVDTQVAGEEGRVAEEARREVAQEARADPCQQ